MEKISTKNKEIKVLKGQMISKNKINTFAIDYLS